MNKEALDKANSLVRSIDVLDDLNSIMCKPYPQFLCSNNEVNSAAFDKETLEQLKTTIKDFIEKRKIELQEKFKSL